MLSPARALPLQAQRHSSNLERSDDTMFKKATQQKQEKHVEKSNRGNLLTPLTPEELHELNMEMACGFGMLPPGGFPDGIWHFF